MAVGKIPCVLAVLVSVTCWAFAENPAELSGRVVDKVTHDPIPDANIFVTGSPLKARSNSEGFFRLNAIPPGTCVVQVNVLGYTTVNKELVLGEGEYRELTFALSEAVYELNPVTVTATRERALVSTVPSSVDIISARDIEQRSVQNVSQAVENIPGVFTNNYGGLGDLKTVSIRGSTSSQVLVLVDGQQINSAQSGDVDLSTIPIAGVERIEVVRGGASALYGADAVGGVINIITRAKPYEASMGGDVQLLMGSFGTRGLEGSSTYSTSRLSSVISYKYLASDGGFTYHTSGGTEVSRSNADLMSHGLFAKETWNLSDDALPPSLSLSGQYFYSNAGVPGSIVFATPRARGINRNGSLNLVYEQKIATPDNSIRVQSYYHNFDYLYDDPSSPDQNSDSHSIAWGAELQGRTALNQWGTVTAGYAYRGDRVSSTSYESKKDRGLQSIYLEDQLSSMLPDGWIVNRIVALPAARWDNFTDFGGQVSPKVGLMVSAGDSWQAALKANYGNSFRAPAFNDLYWKDPYSQGNPDLKPERGKDFDCGLVVRLPSMLGVSADLTYFRNEFTDLIIWQSGSTGLYSPQNVGKAEVHGVEAKFSFVPWKDVLQLSSNYTYLDARNKTDALVDFDNQLPYRPDHTVGVSAQAEFGGLYVLLNWSYVGRRYTTTDNTLSLPPYRTGNILVGYRPALDPAWLDMKLEIRNIGNQEYQIQDGFPMPGREIRVSFGVRYLRLLESNQL